MTSFDIAWCVTPVLLQEMELVILARLKWDLAAVTPYSFLEHLLRMMADTETEAEDAVPERVKKIAETTIILCATEYRYNNIDREEKLIYIYLVNI